jgi:hypothetical protein
MEQWTHKPLVVGSSPTCSPNNFHIQESLISSGFADYPATLRDSPLLLKY